MRSATVFKGPGDNVLGACDNKKRGQRQSIFRLRTCHEHSFLANIGRDSVGTVDEECDDIDQFARGDDAD